LILEIKLHVSESIRQENIFIAKDLNAMLREDMQHGVYSLGTLTLAKGL
jgi:hypothetical protein